MHQNRTFELHMQPLPQFINSTEIIIKRPTALCIVLYCIVVGSRRLMPSVALHPKAYCTKPGL